MSTLKQQMQTLRTQLDLSRQSGEAQYIIHEYREIFNRLQGPLLQLRTIQRQYQAMRSLSDDAPKKIEISEIINSLAKVSTDDLRKFVHRWQEEDYKVRQGDDLANVEASLNGLIKAFKEDISICWNEWIEQITSKSGIEDVLLESQKNIPGSEDIYIKYVKCRQDFRNLHSKIPDEMSVITRLEQLCQQMISLKDQMQFDVPADVSLFFKQLNTNRLFKVPLSLLTPTVYSWLQEHNLLGQFMVERSGRHF